MPEHRQAILYRMVLPDHTCPYGIRAKQMLREAGYEVEDRLLRSRQEVEAFQDANGVATTPQIFIDDERVGGCDDLELYLQDQPTV
jgi:glutaredoxin 3